MKIRTRFAPSPTGMLHVGNFRTALINWLYAKKHNGEFILRIDDTDKERSLPKYEQAIKDNLQSLRLIWDSTFNQSSRLDKYEAAKDYLIKIGRLYECYETKAELEIKKKIQLANKKPPIYDRSALKLTQEQKDKYKASGRKPHYRFLINHDEIRWNDLIKGEVLYHGNKISDPILIREDGSMTYMICSVVDDIDYDITHIIRGEDHITNTAIQIQLFEALEKKSPNLGHLSLIKSKDEKISKREGGFEIAQLLKDGIEPIAISTFFALIGTSKPMTIHKGLDSLIKDFSIKAFSKSPSIYLPKEIWDLNHKIILHYSFDQVKDILGVNISEDFWKTVKPNLNTLKDVKLWWSICNEDINIDYSDLDKDYLKLAARLLPNEEINKSSWDNWINNIKSNTDKRGKDIFVPLRIALTGMKSGPELKYLLPYIGYKKVLSRLIKN